MAIETIQKIRLLSHKSVSEEIFAHIQKLGCCQVIPGSHVKGSENDLASLKAQAREIDDLSGEVRFVMRFLDPYATEKGGGMAKAFGDAPKYSASELEELASRDEMLRAAGHIRSLEKRLSETKAGISRVTGLISALAPIKGIPYTLDFFTKGTGIVQGNILQVPAVSADSFLSKIRSSLGDEAEIFAVPAGDPNANRVVSVIYARAAAEIYQAAVSEFQTSRVEVPANLSGTAESELKSLEAELAALKDGEADVTSEIKAVANAEYKRCERCSDYWGIQRARVEALIAGEQTAQVVVSEFWIPALRMPDLNNIISKYAEMTDMSVVEPNEGEIPPTILTNKKYAVPVEPLISMYGAPSYGGYDPTAVFAPFFYGFFGMCFGDAGYGLLIASLLIALMMRKNITGTLGKFMKILIIGNLCALAFGILTFSWFGDSIEAFPFLSVLMPLQKLQILNPMQDPMTMLGISLALGFFQIILGLVIALRENLRKGDKLAAFADQGGWIVFLCGLVLYGLSSTGMLPLPTGLTGFVAVAGAVILLLTQGRAKSNIFAKLFSGVMSLYNVTSYLGDLLSYSRLLALGLGSAAVGMVINMLAMMVAPSLGGFGIVFAIMIFVIGHVFSMAVNLLGAFVHPLRLQYVEFFSKFYNEASGEDFIPLSMSTQFVELTD